MENYGIEIEDELIKAPVGLLQKSTVSFYLRGFGLEHTAFRKQPVFVRFQAQYSNECWQFDFSPSESISVPRSVLSNNDSMARELISSANLAEELQPSIPFASDNPFEAMEFKDVIEAKAAIARWFGYHLGCLLPQQIEQINSIIAESLDKKVVMMQIKQLFTPIVSEEKS